MRRATQVVVLTFLGATLVRLTMTDAHLNYVNAWMRWPVALSGVAIVVVAVVVGLGSSGDDAGRGRHAGHEGSDVPAASWLLLLPVAVVFLISPPALGAWFAERAANQAVVAPSAADGEEVSLPPLPTDHTSSLTLSEFVVRAEYDPDTLAGRHVALTGFVSLDRDGNWFVTRNSVNCCAADAFRARVVSRGEPPLRNRWVRVTGVYAEPDGSSLARTPDLRADSVRPVAKPSNPYE